MPQPPKPPQPIPTRSRRSIAFRSAHEQIKAAQHACARLSDEALSHLAQETTPSKNTEATQAQIELALRRKIRNFLSCPDNQDDELELDSSTLPRLFRRRHGQQFLYVRIAPNHRREDIEALWKPITYWRKELLTSKTFPHFPPQDQDTDQDRVKAILDLALSHWHSAQKQGQSYASIARQANIQLSRYLAIAFQSDSVSVENTARNMAMDTMTKLGVEDPQEWWKQGLEDLANDKTLLLKLGTRPLMAPVDNRLMKQTLRRWRETYRK